MSKHELEGKFNPKDFEDEIYENWEKKGYFKPSNDKSKKPYTIVIPPPNITGRLHMGHALDETLQDILIRYKRMAGYNALWVPGTDHASIATEAKIVAKLKEEGIHLRAISHYYLKNIPHTSHTFIMNYSSIDLDKLPQAIEILEKILY